MVRWYVTVENREAAWPPSSGPVLSRCRDARFKSKQAEDSWDVFRCKIRTGTYPGRTESPIFKQVTFPPVHPYLRVLSAGYMGMADAQRGTPSNRQCQGNQVQEVSLQIITCHMEVLLNILLPNLALVKLTRVPGRKSGASQSQLPPNPAAAMSRWPELVKKEKQTSSCTQCRSWTPAGPAYIGIPTSTRTRTVATKR